MKADDFSPRAILALALLYTVVLSGGLVIVARLVVQSAEHDVALPLAVILSVLFVLAETPVVVLAVYHAWWTRRLDSPKRQ